MLHTVVAKSNCWKTHRWLCHCMELDSALVKHGELRWKTKQTFLAYNLAKLIFMWKCFNQLFHYSTPSDKIFFYFVKESEEKSSNNLTLDEKFTYESDKTGKKPRNNLTILEQSQRILTGKNFSWRIWTLKGKTWQNTLGMENYGKIWHTLFVKRSLILYIVKLFNSLDIDRNMESFLDFLKINSRFAWDFFQQSHFCYFFWHSQILMYLIVS